MNNKRYYSYIAGLILLFIAITFVMIQGHANIGFWYQADSLFAPHLVQDVFVHHHRITDWYFSVGMTELSSTISYLVMSLVTDHFEAWRIANACFLLTSYFALYVVLGHILYSDRRAALLLPLSALLSLAMVADYKQIPFTLELLLVSAQHEALIIFTLLCLTLLLLKLKNPNNHWALPFLWVSIVVETVSDEIFILSFVMPALIILFVYVTTVYDHTRKKIKIAHYIDTILIIMSATVLSRLLWVYLPLSYLRQGPTLIFGDALIKWQTFLVSGQTQVHFLMIHPFDVVQAVFYYFCFLCSTYPFYLSCVFLAFIILLMGSYHGLRLLRSKDGCVVDVEKQLCIFAMLFVTVEWLSGLCRFFITRHAVDFFANHLLKAYQALHFDIHGFATDTTDFFVMPLFLGVPMVIIYMSSFLKERIKKWLFLMMTLLLLSIISVLMIFAIYRISHTVTYKTQYKNAMQLMQCLETHIQKDRLHTGVAPYWINTPIIFLSHQHVSLASVFPQPGARYMHFMSSWDDIQYKNVDFFVTRYDRFMNDPEYSNYFNAQMVMAGKVNYFGVPDGQFICHVPDGTWLQVYIYRHNQIMMALLLSIRQQGQEHVYINKKNQIIF